MLKQAVDHINSSVPSASATLQETEGSAPVVYVEAASIVDVCKALKSSSDLDMNVLQVMTGCDYPEEDKIEVSYIMNSFRKNHDDELILKVKLPRTNPEIESLASVWKAAEWQERECFDMVGVKFNNNPDLRRILCPEDWEGFPLLKDYKPAEKYLHMTVNPEAKMNIGDRSFADELKAREKEMKAKEKTQTESDDNKE